MTPVSRTEAHRVFADLYRKPRTPDHQQLVDEAILRSNDVFIRIDLIKKVDEDYQNKNKPKDKPKSYFEDKPERESSSRGDSQGKQEQKRQSELVSTESAKQKQAAQKKKAEPAKPATGGGGFFAALFGGGGGQTPIAKFAKDTGAIDVGLFGRNPSISPSAERLFRTLKEDTIIPTIQALRTAEQQGWRLWTPLVYNIIANFSKFFNAFVSLDSLFIDKISPDIFLDRSVKMQMFYIRYLHRDDAPKIILENLPKIVEMDEKLANKMSAVMTGINFGIGLESEKPKLSDVITAFYIVSKKKMVTWDEIIADLRVPAIQEHKFQASREIQKEVEITVAKISDDINVRVFKKEELQNLRTRYFTIDDKGKINFEFLNIVVDDFTKLHIPEAAKSQSVKNTYKSMPHRLLYLLLRDIQVVYINMIEGYIRLGDINQNQELLIVQPGLFRQEIETMNNLVRAIETFNKKFPSFQYTFQQFNSDYSKGTMDQIVNSILRVLIDSAEFFGQFANKLNIMVESHLMARASESKGKGTDKVAVTKEKVIEEIKLQQRFIPHYDKTLVTKERINGMTVEEIIIQLTKYLYNYAVIFKDPQTSQKLTAHRKIEQELIALNKEYERLTNSSFSSDGSGLAAAVAEDEPGDLGE
ncbi:hypothetical protein LPTSP4_00770 [Leptospira ryugenii]|uniref:Uncharacterized protein n=1 Tax=Leptospira ryugenii TaxID=1917863 RepID=A0A2P2DV99_9LEPT|nr:hypothetical protein [Leptospira ryugenii]GBF48578.1 hypothetical protein LPTSP4_00770 [Leptospira ryugenii]